MKSIKKIGDGIRELAGVGGYEIYTGEVVAVDTDKAIIDVQINENVIIYDVRLKVVINDNSGLFIIPKLHSFVAIAQMDGGQDYQLLQASELDKVWLKIGDTTCEASAAGIIINGGNNYGLVKVDSLVQRLNNIEQILTEIKTGYETHTHPAPGGTTSPPVTPYTYSVTQSTRNDLENPKIKH